VGTPPGNGRYGRLPTDDDFIVPTRNMTERLSPESQNAFRQTPDAYWAIRLFCSTFTRLSVQNVQLGP